MKKIVIALISVAGLISPALTIAASSAQAAGSPGCTTQAEFRKIRKDMPLKRVKKVTGSRYRTISQSDFSDGDGFKTIQLRVCDRSDYMTVDLEKTETQVYVPDVQCYEYSYGTECEDYGSEETRYSTPYRVSSKSGFFG